MSEAGVLELLKETGRASPSQLERSSELLKGQAGLPPIRAAALLLERGILSRDETNDLLKAIADTRRPKHPPRDLTGRVFGKFRLVRVLSRGVASVTYAGEHPSLETAAVVRVFLRPGLEERLRAEALRLAKVDHPNLARVLDFGVEDGQCYLATAAVEGPTLEEMAMLPDPAHVAKSVAWMRQLAAALRTLHGAGLVHGEICPARVILSGEGEACLVDFPLSIGEPEDLVLTAVEGIPSFAAPERLKGLPAEPRGDLYSLAATIYWLVGREAPLYAPTYAGLLLRRTLEKPKPDALLRAGASPALIASVLKLLDPDPGARFADATAFLASLPPPGAAPAAAPPSPPVAVKPAPPPPTTRKVVAPKPPPKPVRQSPINNLVLFAGAVLILLVATLWLAIRWKSQPALPKPNPSLVGKPPPLEIPPSEPPTPAPNPRDAERRRLIADAERARKAGDLQQAARLYHEADKIERSAELIQAMTEVDNQLRNQAHERMEFERLERNLPSLPDDAALQACEEFLRRSSNSSYAEQVLIIKQEIRKRIDEARPKPEANKTLDPVPPPPPPPPIPPPAPASPPPPPPATEAAWIFIMKSGGQLRVASYEEQGEKFILKLTSGGRSAISKDDVLRIQKSGSKP